MRDGEVCGLIGPNGAGKTTLFDVASGLRRADTGRVRFDSVDVSRRSAVHLARKRLRRTFQRVQLFGWLSVEENVLTALDWYGGGGGLPADVLGLPMRRSREARRRQAVEEALEACGLTQHRHTAVGSLPIGNARMVELARAIVDSPRLLLLDEPTSGLDETEMGRLAECIAGLREQGGCGVLLVEHDIRFVMDACDRIVVLDLGRVVAEGTPEEIRSDQAVRAAYLGELPS
ncbi:MAG: Lipopolysaccharide export system ATP-binding protein LptB [Acidimicrobiales bacterium]|nr:Lipopolysaccharide export system ATP-binding protein LptB [Acidimicrobiales bacterium]